jgi:hypothetical protein
MNKALPVCLAVLSLVVVSSFPRLAAAAAPGPAGPARPQVQAPARPQAQPQATPPATRESVVKALPLLKKKSTMQMRPGALNVDLRPDVAASVQTEPSVPNLGKYNPYSNMGKPLKVTAVVENGGLTKADKVNITVVFWRTPGVPLGQNTWESHYTADLGPGESVSYPFSILFQSTMMYFSVTAEFAGDEKNKGNNEASQFVNF